jgi:hypothetical protein
VLYDETVIVTRYLWILGLSPCTSLPTATQNREYMVGVFKHIVKMLGILSEYAQCHTFSDYNNGLSLDVEFCTENYDYIFDAKRNGVFIRLTSAAVFGTSQAPIAARYDTIFPMVQRIPGAILDLSRQYPLYTTQALPELWVEGFFASATPLAAVRGIPHGLQCHSLTSACILGTRDMVNTAISRLGLLDPAANLERLFMVVLTSIRHACRLANKSKKSTHQQVHPTYGYTTVRNTTNKTDQIITPKDAVYLDECCLEIIWLEDTEQTYGVVFNKLREALLSEPLLSVTICGLPLELSQSLQHFKTHLVHLPVTSVNLRVSALVNARPCISVREIVHTLSINVKNVDLYLMGVFIIHSAQDQDSSIKPWAIILTWNTFMPYLDLIKLKPLAAEGFPLTLLSKDFSAVLDIMGRTQFQLLGHAANDLPSTCPSRGSGTLSSDAGKAHSNRNTAMTTAANLNTASPIAVYSPPLAANLGTNPSDDIDQAANLCASTTRATDESDTPDMEVVTSGPPPERQLQSIVPCSSPCRSSIVPLRSTTDGNVQVLQELIQQTIQPSLRSFQRELDASKAALESQKSINTDLIARMEALTTASTSQSADMAQFNQKVVQADLRSIAKEYRDIKHKYTQARDDLEELQIEAAEAPGDPKLTRRVTKAQKATEELYRDMHGVLSSLAQQCAMAKLSITDFIPAEEAASLTQTAHE